MVVSSSVCAATAVAATAAIVTGNHPPLLNLQSCLLLLDTSNDAAGGSSSSSNANINNINQSHTSLPETTATTAGTSVTNQEDEEEWGFIIHRHLPYSFRFAISAGLGNIAFFLIDQFLYYQILKKLPLLTTNNNNNNILQSNLETISFFVSYLILIIIQHWLNALLLFGLESIDTKEKYWNTLWKSFTAYSGSLLGSSIVNAMLTKMGIAKFFAFWGTICLFGIINFFLIAYVITGNSPPSSTSLSSTSSSMSSSSGLMLSTAHTLAFVNGGGYVGKRKMKIRNDDDSLAKRKAKQYPNTIHSISSSYSATSSTSSLMLLHKYPFLIHNYHNGMNSNNNNNNMSLLLSWIQSIEEERPQNKQHITSNNK